MKNHKVVVTGKINPTKVMKKVKKKTGKKMEFVDIDKEDKNLRGRNEWKWPLNCQQQRQTTEAGDIGLKIYISSETKPKSVSPAHSSPPKLEVSETTHHTDTPLALSPIQAPVVNTVKSKPGSDNCAVASPESQNDKTSTE
ncbi:Uncharacterized protein Fot_23301 [Forsythia ovata]|uniref:Uncharacterized protein n=1 Tax=Forsythia ovata TaxID=205694 RepID=A0ABD1V049_9LAMI